MGQSRNGEVAEDHSNGSAAAIRHQMEQTRAEMSSTVNAIDPDFTPAAEWKFAIGATYDADFGFLGDDYRIDLDFIRSQTKDAARTAAHAYLTAGGTSKNSGIRSSFHPCWRTMRRTSMPTQLPRSGRFATRWPKPSPRSPAPVWS